MQTLMKIPHYVAFHLNFHCLSKNHLWILVYKGLKKKCNKPLIKFVIIVCQLHKRRQYDTNCLKEMYKFKEKHCNVITLFAGTLHCLQVSMPQVFLVLHLGQEIMCDRIRNWEHLQSMSIQSRIQAIQ